MSANSSIEWTEATWNPTLGCSKISPGCKGCYAILDVHRMAGNPNPKIRAANQGLTVIEGGHPNWNGKVRVVPERFLIPYKRKKPTTYFVNSLSDLFHEELLFGSIALVYAAMVAADWHTFQVLTKRAERLPLFFAWLKQVAESHRQTLPAGATFNERDVLNFLWLQSGGPGALPQCAWPPEHIWLGVSAEDQQRADERILHLLETPAAVRFVSLEPLLEDLGDISGYLRAKDEESLECSVCPWRGQEREANPDDAPCFACPNCGEECAHVPLDELRPGIDWVIVGGESGPGARTLWPEWVRSIRDQCTMAGVPFFFKQWGGKRKALTGRELDGRTWDEMPEVKEAANV